MLLSAEQIINENLLRLENTHGKIAQVGFDLSIKSIQKVGGGIGKILKDKTVLNKYTAVETTRLDEVEGYLLYEGVYDLTFNEGCDIPPNRAGFICQRSSLLRNGAIIRSSIFDPGFKTENIGTCMMVFETLFIQTNARVAQFYFHECKPVKEEQLYGGVNHTPQWQGDEWRKEHIK